MSTPPVFDNEMVLRFVRSYRDNSCLWDFNSPAYKNKSVREEAYERLVADMDLPGLTVLDVKNKIKNIRSTYCQELKKIQTAKLLGREPYVPGVFWFKELDSFLHANTTPRTDVTDRKVPKYLTKFHNLPPHTMHNDFFLQTYSESAEETNNSMPEPLEGEMPLFVQQDSIMSLADEPINSDTSEPLAKKQRRDSMFYQGNHDDLSDQIRDTVKDLKNIASLLSGSDSDEFDLFGKIVALQLKKMSLCTALEVQAKIQNLLSLHRISDIQREQRENKAVEIHKETIRNRVVEESSSENVGNDEEVPETATSQQVLLTCASENNSEKNVSGNINVFDS